MKKIATLCLTAVLTTSLAGTASAASSNNSLKGDYNNYLGNLKGSAYQQVKVDQNNYNSTGEIASLKIAIENIKLEREIVNSKIAALDNLYKEGRINVYSYNNQKRGLENKLAALKIKEDNLNAKLALLESGVSTGDVTTEENTNSSKDESIVYNSNNEINGIEIAIQNIELKKEIINSKIEALDNLYAEGKINVNSYNGQKTGLQKELASLDIKKAELEKKLNGTGTETPKTEVGSSEEVSKLLDELKSVKAELKDLDSQEDAIKANYKSGKISKDEYKKQQKELESKKDSLEDKEDNIENKLESLGYND